MIWVIASIPFWASAAYLFFLATGTVLYASFARSVPQEKFNNAMVGAIVLLIVAGVLAYIAAKIAS